jgi:membrane fusion protein (multidrug efflux system)
MTMLNESHSPVSEDVSEDMAVDRPTVAVPEQPPEEQPLGNPQARKRGFLLLGGAALIALAGYGGYAYFVAAASQTTDDAYVAGDVVAITARETGHAVALHADNTESVKKGQPLLDFDSSTADATMAAAEADLARAVRNVRSSFAKVDEGGAEIVQAQAELSRARNDLSRRQAAAREGAVSGEEVAHAADAVRSAQAALDVAHSRHAQAETTVQGTGVGNNPDVLAAIAAVRKAAIIQGHMHLKAPVDGVIAQRSVQLGQQVTAGTPLMAVVPLDRVWVDANFRETQLADIRVGQPVTLTSDLYGGKVVFHGHVLGLGAGSGSAFALLPPQNASGNWIKIVQRLPVRIALDPAELRQTPLRIGISVTVKIDTTHHDGPAVARAAVASSRQSGSQDAGPDVDGLINRIIAANNGGGRAR